MSGTLYIVATPIGNLADITLRALEVLRNVAFIAAEDTRHSHKLLAYYGITTRLMALHEHNEWQQCAKIVQLLQEGQDIALISDAGTPLISDPGYHLVAAVQAEKLRVSPIPGACAAIAALSAAGLPTDKFFFEGFLPAKSQQRQHRLQALADQPYTLIFYEAPHRIKATVHDLVTIFGRDRTVVLARELTKTYETIRRTSLAELESWILQDEQQQRGEIVLLVAGHTPVESSEETKTTLEPLTVLQTLLTELPVKQAASLTSKLTGGNKNWLYQQALLMKKE